MGRNGDAIWKNGETFRKRIEGETEMAKKNYKAMADGVVAAVGGEGNIANVTHCMTRLRLQLVDVSKLNEDQAKKIPGILNLIIQNGEYQFVVGQDVASLYQEMTKFEGIKAGGSVEDAEAAKQDSQQNVTLYHYDLPWALVEKYGGWLDRRVVEDFAYYANYVIGEFKDKVKYWTTINEQSIIVQYWTQKCYIPEEVLQDNQKRYQINHHMNLAQATANKLVHELVPGRMAGAPLGYSPIYPLTSDPKDVMAMQNAQALRNDYYTDVYFKGHYNKAAQMYLEEQGLAPAMEEGDLELLADPMAISDFLALNNYASECAKWCEKGEKEIQWSGVNRSGKKGEISGFETHPGF